MHTTTQAKIIATSANLKVMEEYLLLLRGVNVGGNSLVRMADLKTALNDADFQNVKTYIQSGNIFVTSTLDKTTAADQIVRLIETKFGVVTTLAIFTKREWQEIIESAPKWWGKDPEWKHNLLVMIGAYDMSKVIEAVGTLKPAIEAMEPGPGVLYQSMSRALFGRTTTGKLASSPVYKEMTVRNYNTANKLLGLFS